jgi:hypothetical protein
MLQRFSLWINVLAFLGLSCVHPRPGNYFPLTPNSTWTYKITSRSEELQFQVVDKVIGVEYVPALRRSGIVVDERYEVDGGGTRPLLYYSRKGYLTRLFGFDYYHQTIIVPPWGRSEDARFLPSTLAPDITWHSVGAPYGGLPGSFHLREFHHTFAEPEDVIVAAGHFGQCIRVDTSAVFEGGPYARFKQQVKLYYSDWYAPDVGLVKSVARQGTTDGAESERVELLHFNVAPGTVIASSAK